MVVDSKGEGGGRMDEKRGGVGEEHQARRGSLSVENEQADAEEGRPNPSRDKFSGANADGENIHLPCSATTSRIGNLSRLIHSLI